VAHLQKIGPHATLQREILWTTTVEIHPSDIVFDQLRGLDGQLGIRGADLVDEAGFLDRVTLEDGFRFLHETYRTRFLYVREGNEVRFGKSLGCDRVANVPSTILSEPMMALSTISGPQTKSAPYSSDKSLVGTSNPFITGLHVRREPACTLHWKGEGPHKSLFEPWARGEDPSYSPLPRT
jgi:hypothetical protein